MDRPWHPVGAQVYIEEGRPNDIAIAYALESEVVRLKTALLVAEVELEKVAQGVVDRGRAESAAAHVRRERTH